MAPPPATPPSSALFFVLEAFLEGTADVVVSEDLYAPEGVLLGERAATPAPEAYSPAGAPVGAFLRGEAGVPYLEPGTYSECSRGASYSSSGSATPPSAPASPAVGASCPRYCWRLSVCA